MVDLDNYRQFKQGAEGRLYLGKFLGQDCIVKHRFVKEYRHPRLDEQLTKDRMKSEVRSMIRCQAIGVRTPTIFLADIESATIVMEYLAEADLAKDFIQRLMSTCDAKDRDTLLAMARRIGQSVGKLHNAGIIHGDLTTSNILLERDGLEFRPVLIDFGLAYADGSAEDKGVDLYVLERAISSAHPGAEFLFAELLVSYESELGKKARKEVIDKYEEIRMRGRKRLMIG